jgi:hypothetical protein
VAHPRLDVNTVASAGEEKQKARQFPTPCDWCKTAKVALARRLAVNLYWMWRKGWNYEQLISFGSHAGQPGNPDGVQ